MNIEDCICKIRENTLGYSGNKIEFKDHLKKTLIGGTAILGLKALNAPDFVETAAYIYTVYNGFKAFKDYNEL